ncbi:hypothetical protein GUJ93_ZPchr0010g11217 [Zizania palustris]|uniref:Uncharacterized protein n=1 Tax=Zizania palustris TaxID=103762 RepID=A0A8J5W6C2_ZIZPA|nr:hypothetical protein GUJ93_ZPchr0010g11217 [Zizania palustris]
MLCLASMLQGSTVKSKKKSSWGFDGLRRWKKAGNEEATAGGERPNYAMSQSSYSECRLEASSAIATDAKEGQEEAAYGHKWR